MIPFDEQGMRSFQNVKEAIKYFTENGKIPQKRIVALFQLTYQIVSGKYSMNVLPLTKLSVTERKMFLIKAFKITKNESFERIQIGLDKELEKWNVKFSKTEASVIDNNSTVSTEEKVTTTV